MSDSPHISETVSAGQLRAFIERIERLEEERKSLADDIADVYRELAGDGYDKDATKVIVKIRRTDDGLSKWRGASETVDFYLSSLGMLGPAIEDRAPARTREIIEKFDAETGEITEQEQPETAHQSPAPTHKTAGSAPRYEGSEGANTEHENVDGSTVRAGHAGQPFDALSGQIETRNGDIEFVERNTSGPDAKRASHSPETAPQSQSVHEARSMPAGNMGDEISERVGLAGPACAHDDETANTKPAPNSHSAEIPPAADKPETAVTPLPAVSGAIPEGIPAFLLKERKPLRPNCLHPDNCAGYGTHTCHSCTRAMAESEAA